MTGHAGPAFDVVTLGVRVTVPWPGWLPAGARARIRAAWSRAVGDGRGDDPSAAELPVTRLPEWGDRPSTEAAVAARIATRVTLAAIEQRAGQLLLLHAAGIADPATGRTVALVGPSGCGKTTATSQLARQWGYLSDETVGVDPATLQVVAHPKPLSVSRSATAPTSAARPGATSTGPRPAKDQVGPDELGLLPAPPSCQLARIVFLDRDPGHRGPVEVVPESPVRAIAALAAQASWLSRWEAPLTMIAQVVAATGGVLRVRYAEAAHLGTVLPRLLAATDPAPSRLSGTTPPRLRAPVRDAVSDGDELALLLPADLGGGVAEQVVVLGGIGPLLWELTDRPRSRAELVSAVVARHGSPPTGSAESLVTAALDDLARYGIATPSR